MVHGLEKFKEYFADFTSRYVFIGGTACDILLNEAGAAFRATRDLDVVLMIEALDKSFGLKLWEFIEDGGYKNRQKSSGNEQFYRFSQPDMQGFPYMIELFSRKPVHMNLHPDSVLIPVHIGDGIASLSAILLNEAYYDLLVRGRKVVNVSPLSRVEVGDEIRKDVNRFLGMIKVNKPDLRSLGIRVVTFEELLDRINELYVLQEAEKQAPFGVRHR